MKNIRCASLIFIAATLLLGSCSKKKKNSMAGYIPANASMVLAMNPGQLLGKLEKDSAALNRIVAMLPLDEDGPPSTKKISSKIDEAGVDLSQPVYVALNVPSNITDPDAIVRIIIPLKDAEKFHKTLPHSEGEMKKEGKFTYITFDEAAVGFNDKAAILVGRLNADAITGTGMHPNNFRYPDTINDTPPMPEPESSFTSARALALVKESFNLETKNSLASNDDFDEMPIEKNDLKLWFSFDNGLSLMAKGEASAGMMALEPLLKGSSSSSVLNFETGKIAYRTKMYFNKDAAKVINKSKERDLDLSMVSSYPGTIDGFAGIAFDPAMIGDLLDFTQMTGNVNLALGLSGSGMKLGDILDCFTGDMIALFSNMPDNPGKIKQHWAVAIKLNNKSTFTKFLTSPVVMGSIRKEGDLYIVPAKDNDSMDVYFNIKNDWVYVSDNMPLLAQYMAGTVKNSAAETTLARFAKKPMGFYISIPSFMNDTTAAGQLTKATIPFNGLTVTGEHFEKNYLESNAELEMKVKDQNSITALLGAALFYRSQMMTLEPEDEDMPPLVPMPVK